MSSSSIPSGPDGVKIENADSAIATVTGLEVGTYTFMLTVTDDRNLENSDTVTVIVREGEPKCVEGFIRHLRFLTFAKMRRPTPTIAFYIKDGTPVSDVLTFILNIYS